MIQEEIIGLLRQNQELLEKTYKSAEKTRKYFLYTAIFTVLAFLLPLIGLMFIIPSFINTYTNSMVGLL